MELMHIYRKKDIVIAALEYCDTSHFSLIGFLVLFIR